MGCAPAGARPGLRLSRARSARIFGIIGPRANNTARTELCAVTFCNGWFDEPERMELRMATRRTDLCRLLLAAAACCGAIEFAQAAPGSPDEHVTVQQDAPYTVRQEVTEQGNMSKMEVRQTTVSTGVSYSDLDLSKESDIAILKDRIRTAAMDVCRQADRRAGSLINRPLYPSPDCVSSAKQQARADVNRIVANARAPRTVAAN